MSFIVWHDFGTEGWQPSDTMDDLNEVWGYLLTNPHRSTGFVITEGVDVELVRKPVIRPLAPAEEPPF